MHRWCVGGIASILVLGLCACAGSSAPSYPSECNAVGRLVALRGAEGTTSTVPSDLVPDSVKRVSAAKPPQLQGGMAALREDLEYPAAATENSPGGVVHVSFIVDEEGQPRNLKVTRGASYHFNQAALDAVRKQQFTPATMEGKPICMPMTLPIHFRSQ